ncbi:NADPH:quinone reductase [Gordonia terrae]|uniref:NADPH:quinone reductase n=1 Tax=Gordonia terrae TaxID=2055 RepID=UPI00200B9E5F|nr:NADPH:quinone reductase [Gordonia terrae]UPW08058.1 NADPH:quinone reductase [Gordonia terrae]
MKRILVEKFGGPDELKCVDSVGHLPGDDEVVVRVYASGVNPADAYIRTGQYAFALPELPYTPGTDCAGEVLAVGSGVDRWVVGDRVYVVDVDGTTSGTYAQTVNCVERTVRPLADRLSFAQGAALGIPAVTAYRALHQRGGAQPGEAVLVHGASGAVGSLVVQMAVAAGLWVIGTAGSETGRESVLADGAHHVLDHTRPGYLDAVPGLTAGAGVSLIIEMLANVNLEHDFTVLGRRGRIVIVGSRGTLNFAPRRTMVAEADIRGTAVWNMNRDEVKQALQHIEVLVEHRLLTPRVGATFALSEAAAAHRSILGVHPPGRMVLDCT